MSTIEVKWIGEHDPITEIDACYDPDNNDWEGEYQVESTWIGEHDPDVEWEGSS